LEITRGKIASAQKAIIYGPEGIGKSTFASQFPNPLVSDTEGSTKHLDVPRLPVPTSWQMLLDQAAWVKAHPDVCGTYIVDTADWAERLCIAHICAKAQKSGIEDFGYGKGFTYLEEEFGRYLNVLSDVISVGINVVLVAHAQMRKFEQPNEAGAYDRWEMKLQKKTAPLVKEWADLILFVNYKIFVVDVDGKNKAQGGKRVIYTTHHPCWDAKNRHDLPEEIPMDYAAIAHCIPSRSAVAPQQVAQPVTQPAPQQSAPEPIAQPEPQPMPDAPVQQQAALINDLEAEGVPKALADLMRASDVTLDEIHAAIVAKKYFPPNTPFRNYPKDFVEGALIGAWPQVLQVIEQNRVPF
jgi:hypothetical protein